MYSRYLTITFGDEDYVHVFEILEELLTEYTIIEVLQRHSNRGTLRTFIKEYLRMAYNLANSISLMPSCKWNTYMDSFTVELTDTPTTHEKAIVITLTYTTQ